MTWKLADLAAAAGSTPFAWIDDDIRQDALVWATGLRQPCFLHRTDPLIDITADLVDELLAFAAAPHDH